jgi:RNA polymerase sigma factor (sigma-70 family)
METPDGVPSEYWELLNRYRDELIAQALGILGSAHDAEDVVQETFCEALRNTKRMSQSESLGAWMRNTNRCNALNRLRSKTRDKKKSERMIQLDPPHAHTTGGFSALELRDSVAKALEKLPAHMREIVKLRYWENLSYREISERLKLPQGTVGRILCEASLLLYENMRTHLEPQESGQPPAPASDAPEDAR